MEESIIPEAFLSSQIHSLKDLEDFLLIQKTDEGFSEALLREVLSIILCEIPFRQSLEEWQVLGNFSYGL